MTTTPTAYKFNIAAGYSLTATTFAVRINEPGNDAGDYVQFYYQNTGTHKAALYDDEPPDSWSSIDDSSTAYFVGKDCVE